MKKPNKIEPQIQNKIDEVIDGILCNTPYNDFRKEIQGYVADVVRGRAYSKEAVFTVPYWAYRPTYPKNRKTKGGYFIYYVAHELTHLIAHKKFGGRCNHDSNFYKIFMEICPKEYQHFELGYKKTAAKYGISKK